MKNFMKNLITYLLLFLFIVNCDDKSKDKTEEVNNSKKANYNIKDSNSFTKNKLEFTDTSDDKTVPNKVNSNEIVDIKHYQHIEGSGKDFKLKVAIEKFNLLNDGEFATGGSSSVVFIRGTVKTWLLIM